MKWIEKRRCKRIYLRIEVECRSKSTWQMVEASNISSGGMFVATEIIEPVNSHLDILFEIGTEKTEKRFVHAEGVVMWARPKQVLNDDGSILPAGMGIKFIKFVPALSKRFVSYLCDDQGDQGGAK